MRHASGWQGANGHEPLARAENLRYVTMSSSVRNLHDCGQEEIGIATTSPDQGRSSIPSLVFLK